MITYKPTTSHSEILSGLVGKQVWHVIGCHLCVGSTPTSDRSQDDPGYW